MVRQLGTASSGERVMIAAALSLIPEGWVEDFLEPEELERVPTFRLHDVSVLDSTNARAIVETVATHSGHPEVAEGGW